MIQQFQTPQYIDFGYVSKIDFTKEGNWLYERMTKEDFLCYDTKFTSRSG